jgi:HSP20 family protein
MKLNEIIPWKNEGRRLARARTSSDPLALFHRRIDSLFEDLFGGRLSGPFGAEGFAPQIDLSETEKEVRVTAELPGLDEKDVEVTLTANVLTLKGEKKEEHEEEKGDYYHSERSYGFFERSVQLPEGVDPDKAEAKFKKGVLRVSIPRKPGAGPARRKIELQPG